jgi:hypothetical protein
MPKVPAARPADVLIQDAMLQLESASIDSRFARGSVGAGRPEQALSRSLEALLQLRLAGSLRRWQAFCMVDAATQPIEDEVVSTRRELRRALAMLQATHT